MAAVHGLWNTCRVAAFLIRRFLYLVTLVIISTSVAYVLAATQLNPRSRYEGRNPPPPPEVVDAVLDAVNMNPNTPLIDRFAAGPAASSAATWDRRSTTPRSARKSAAACGSACGW